MEQSVGILAYGSLISNPGEEICNAIMETYEGVTTPFSVEFARSSKSRRGAPTLVPVASHGTQVQAHLLVVNLSVDEAKDRLYRRETNKVGKRLRYKHPSKPGPNDVVIGCLYNFHGIDVVLYTQIAANIKDLSALKLANLAIRSARGSNDGRDGISYLMDAKNHGIKTTLSDAYEEEIKQVMQAGDLLEALQNVRKALPNARGHNVSTK